MTCAAIPGGLQHGVDWCMVAPCTACCVALLLACPAGCLAVHQAPGSVLLCLTDVQQQDSCLCCITVMRHHLLSSARSMALLRKHVAMSACTAGTLLAAPATLDCRW
jgi:hypothetical protein